jgi:Arc/MetJ-type ribon-helix-helix transcriptional regulator
MTSLTIELPDKLAEDLQSVVETGSFNDQGEVVRQALREFLHRHRLELMERFQREDIAWALQQGKAER